VTCVTKNSPGAAAPASGRRRDWRESPSCNRRDFLRVTAVAVCAAMAAPGFAADTTRRKVFTLSLVNGALRGDDTIKVQQGDDVELRWSSDKPAELHLHGYDIEIKVAPSAPAVMSFKASIPGRFPVEPHGNDGGRHHPILYLEVHP
jgi:hypothetical protein